MDRWRDETIEWWGGERVRLAFLVAPLVCPVIIMVWAVVAEPSLMSLLAGLFMGVGLLPFLYIPILLFGVPVYRFLCSRHLTAFWVAPIAGFVAGTGAALLQIDLGWPAIGSFRLRRSVWCAHSDGGLADRAAGPAAPGCIGRIARKATIIQGSERIER
jgi:hypothetical protein